MDTLAGNGTLNSLFDSTLLLSSSCWPLSSEMFISGFPSLDIVKRRPMREIVIFSSPKNINGWLDLFGVGEKFRKY